MKEFGTTVEQMAHVSVKNHLNAFHNPYAQKRNRYTDRRRAQLRRWSPGRSPASTSASCPTARRRSILASRRGAGEAGSRPAARSRARWCRSPASAAAPTRCAWPTARTSTTTTFLQRLRHRAGGIVERDAGLLQEAVGSRLPLPRRALVPRRAHGRQHGLQARRHHRPAAGARLRRAARRLHLVRDPDLRGHGAVPLRRGRAVRRLGQGVHAGHRLWARSCPRSRSARSTPPAG